MACVVLLATLLHRLSFNRFYVLRIHLWLAWCFAFYWKKLRVELLWPTVFYFVLSLQTCVVCHWTLVLAFWMNHQVLFKQFHCLLTAFSCLACNWRWIVTGWMLWDYLNWRYLLSLIFLIRSFTWKKSLIELVVLEIDFFGIWVYLWILCNFDRLLMYFLLVMSWAIVCEIHCEGPLLFCKTSIVHCHFHVNFIGKVLQRFDILVPACAIRRGWSCWFIFLVASLEFVLN